MCHELCNLLLCTSFTAIMSWIGTVSLLSFVCPSASERPSEILQIKRHHLTTSLLQTSTDTLHFQNVLTFFQNSHFPWKPPVDCFIVLIYRRWGFWSSWTASSPSPVDDEVKGETGSFTSCQRMRFVYKTIWHDMNELRLQDPTSSNLTHPSSVPHPVVLNPSCTCHSSPSNRHPSTVRPSSTFHPPIIHPSSTHHPSTRPYGQMTDFSFAPPPFLDSWIFCIIDLFWKDSCWCFTKQV